MAKVALWRYKNQAAGDYQKSLSARSIDSLVCPAGGFGQQKGTGQVISYGQDALRGRNKNKIAW
jgi:hypothetical protein